ncbi:hypothetical protein C8R48DRAFT_722513 [Suillus tomentosus]|nr:hypothetical protein C8R48DRAFT_722513 [Suillus tomentosus]
MVCSRRSLTVTIMTQSIFSKEVFALPSCRGYEGPLSMLKISTAERHHAAVVVEDNTEQMVSFGGFNFNLVL